MNCTASRLRILNQVAIAALFVAPIAQGATGELDQTFAMHGRLTLIVGRFGSEARAVLQQGDDRLVIAGSVGGRDVMVARLMPDGGLDPSFGSDGIVTVDFFGARDAGYAAIQQADGRIVVAGAAGTGDGTSDIGLVRINPDGSLDQTFGTGGRVALDLQGSSDVARALVEQPDGRLVVAGSTDAGGGDRMMLARFNADGAVDVSFGQEGIVALDFGAGADSRAAALILQPDGKLVVAGQYAGSAGGAADFAAARVTAAGVLDETFAGDGLATADLGGNNEGATSLAIEPDGGLLIAGFSAPVSTVPPRAVIVRLNPDGIVEATFGASGTAGFDASDPLGSVAAAIVAQPDGAFVVAGIRGTDLSSSGVCECEDVSGTADLFIARFDAAGRLDQSYGAAGVVTADFGVDDRYLMSMGSALVRQRDGRYVAAGFTISAASVAVARFSDSSQFPGLVGVTETQERFVNESVGSLSYTIRRTGGTQGPVAVDYATVAGPAAAGLDFVAATGTLRWSDGDVTDRTVTVDVIDDDAVEDQEDFRLELSNASDGAQLAARSSTTIIGSDDGPGEIAFLDALTPIQVDENAGSIAATVRRWNGSTGAVTVNYSVASGTAAGWSDFEATSGTLTWADGDASGKRIPIRIVDDDIPELDEHFRITLRNPTGGAKISLLGGSQLVVIRANDGADPAAGVVSFATSDETVTEAHATLAIAVSRTGGSAGAISVDYAAAAGSATSGADFEPAQGTLHWGDGDDGVKFIEVQIDDDDRHEDDESFSIMLSNVTGGASLGSRASATVTITDTDPSSTGAGSGGGGGGGCAGDLCLIAAALLLANATARRAGRIEFADTAGCPAATAGID